MAQMGTYFSLKNADTAHAAKALKRELDTLPGVSSVSIGGDGRLAVDYDSTGIQQEQIRQKLLELGYQFQEEHP